MERQDGREVNQLRPVKITRDFIKYAEGSAFIEMGDTKVLCTATVEEKVPFFLKGEDKGWITAEYSLLPRSTQMRTVREAARGRVGGRTHEIQRLIGRSLRSVVDLNALKGHTIWLDCDVVQADGGTRTAAITGSFVALVDAMKFLRNKKNLFELIPVKEYLAAISVGKVAGEIMLDLCYAEDVNAEVDMNVVMTAGGRFVEVQGTAEGPPFTKEELSLCLELAEQGIKQLTAYQCRILVEDMPVKRG